MYVMKLNFILDLIETFPFGSFLLMISLFLMPSQRDEQIEKSVSRMMTIIDFARNIRDRHNKPIKSPLRYASNLSSAISIIVVLVLVSLFCSIFIFNLYTQLITFVYGSAGR